MICFLVWLNHFFFFFTKSFELIDAITINFKNFTVVYFTLIDRNIAEMYSAPASRDTTQKADVHFFGHSPDVIKGGLSVANVFRLQMRAACSLMNFCEPSQTTLHTSLLYVSYALEEHYFSYYFLIIKHTHTYTSLLSCPPTASIKSQLCMSYLWLTSF